MKIKIKTENGKVEAEIDESRNPKTAKAIIEALPITGEANRWGDEIYFEIPVEIGGENVQQDMEIGSLAYWPPGNAFCIFFGRTPASTSDRPRMASPGNVFGKVTSKNFVNVLKRVKDGEEIRIEEYLKT